MTVSESSLAGSSAYLEKVKKEEKERPNGLAILWTNFSSSSSPELRIYECSVWRFPSLLCKGHLHPFYSLFLITSRMLASSALLHPSTLLTSFPSSRKLLKSLLTALFLSSTCLSIYSLY